MLPGKPSPFAVDQCLGASAGALVATALILDYPASKLMSDFMELAEKVKSSALGPFSPNCNLNTMFREQLEKVNLLCPLFYAVTSVISVIAQATLSRNLAKESVVSPWPKNIVSR